MSTNIRLFDLKISFIDTETITLEQDDGNGERECVQMHVSQVQLLAQRMGLLREVSVSDAALLRTEREFSQRMRARVDILQRRLLTVRDRGLALQSNFRQFADFEHADLASEMAEINGLVDLMDLAADDFVDDYDAAPRSAPGTAAETPLKDTPTSAAAPSAPGSLATPNATEHNTQGNLLEGAL